MTWTPLEIAANLFTVICIFLAGRNSIHTWWTGIVACVLFGALFYQAKLYADVTLQVFFVVTSLVGWYGWMKKTSEDVPGIVVLSLDRASEKTMVTMVSLAVLTAIGYGAVLHFFTDAYAPWIDSLVLTFSVIAQLLLMRRKLENWPVWVFVNLLSAPLYFSRELYLTAGLYTVFFVHALWAWKHWLNLADAKPERHSNKIWAS